MTLHNKMEHNKIAQNKIARCNEIMSYDVR